MIPIGQIVKPQGIKGEIKIICEDRVERYLNLHSVFIDGIERKILSINARSGDLYLLLEGVSDRNTAELLRGKEVLAKKEDLERLAQNEFYFKDLIGAKVVDEEGKEIGELIDIDQYGAADVISIRERNIIFSVPFLDNIFLKINYQLVVVDRTEYDNNKIAD